MGCNAHLIWEQVVFGQIWYHAHAYVQLSSVTLQNSFGIVHFFFLLKRLNKILYQYGMMQ